MYVFVYAYMNIIPINHSLQSSTTGALTWPVATLLHCQQKPTEICYLKMVNKNWKKETSSTKLVDELRVLCWFCG